MGNYTIRTKASGQYFGGWDFEGKLIILPIDRSELRYRMQRPLAVNTVEKIEKTLGLECLIEKYM